MLYLDVILAGIMLIITSYTDLKENKIPNKIVLPISILGLLNVALLFDIKSAFQQLIAMLIALVIGFVLFKLNKMGAGDVKLICALITTIGWQDALLIVSLGMIIGVIYAGFRLFAKKEKGKIMIPLAIMCLISFMIVMGMQLYFFIRFS